ncbi:MAG: tetratricopeptide repeat protein, partial [Planctomycetota bacterium]
SLKDAARLMPHEAAPRNNLALLYERVGRLGEAEERLREALALAPEDLEIIGHLARVAVRQGKWNGETVAWLKDVATQDDDETWRAWAQAQLARRSPVSPDEGSGP